MTTRKLSDEVIKSTTLDDLNRLLREGMASEADGYRAQVIINEAHDRGDRLYRAHVRSCSGAFQGTTTIRIELVDPVDEAKKAQAPTKPAKPLTIKVDSETYHDGTNGACLACGEIQYGGCEPDARGYECEACGKRKVYGLEELVIMGRIEVAE